MICSSARARHTSDSIPATVFPFSFPSLQTFHSSRRNGTLSNARSLQHLDSLTHLHTTLILCLTSWCACRLIWTVVLIILERVCHTRLREKVFSSDCMNFNSLVSVSFPAKKEGQFIYRAMFQPSLFQSGRFLNNPAKSRRAWLRQCIFQAAHASCEAKWLFVQYLLNADEIKQCWPLCCKQSHFQTHVFTN